MTLLRYDNILKAFCLLVKCNDNSTFFPFSFSDFSRQAKSSILLVLAYEKVTIVGLLKIYRYQIIPPEHDFPVTIP